MLAGYLWPEAYAPYVIGDAYGDACYRLQAPCHLNHDCVLDAVLSV